MPCVAHTLHNSGKQLLVQLAASMQLQYCRRRTSEQQVSGASDVADMQQVPTYAYCCGLFHVKSIKGLQVNSMHNLQSK
jgi:hypothetical protein